MHLVIAIVAGCAAALMFVSVISGALISLVLFYLAPLPLIVAALGWGSATALIGGLLTCAGVGLFLGFPYMTAFALTVALPGWWLGHLAMLARPEPDANAGAEPELRWYPVGRLLVWIASFASLTVIAALLSLGTDATTITDVLKRGLIRVFGAPGADTVDADSLITVLVMIAPAAATMVTMAALSLNLWLAAWIVQTSGRLARPWPALSQTALPPLTLAALAAAILLCFAGGLPAMFAEIVSAALIVAYAFTGFAVLHAVTRASSMRGLWLASSYAIVVVFGWPLLAVALVGIADAIFGFRRRRRPQFPPPTLSS